MCLAQDFNKMAKSTPQDKKQNPTPICLSISISRKIQKEDIFSYFFE